MTRPLTGPLTATLFAAGCITAHVGIDTPLGEDRRSSVAVEVLGSVDAREYMVGYLGKLSIGEGGATVGLGSDACLKPPKLYVQPRLCGRLLPLELGSKNGQFVLGAGSFAMGPGVWVPFGPRGPRAYESEWGDIVPGIWLQAWGGLDIRPLDDQVVTHTYGFRIGSGVGAVYHRTLEDYR